MIAVKNWFLEKNNMEFIKGKTITVVKETEKAVYIKANGYFMWIPKSVIIDEWEKDTSGFGYHSYLVETYHKAYNDGLIEHSIINGRYRGDAFIHQLNTRELVEALTNKNVAFMTRTEWNNR